MLTEAKIGPEDLDLLCVTDEVETAVRHILAAGDLPLPGPDPDPSAATEGTAG